MSICLQFHSFLPQNGPNCQQSPSFCPQNPPNCQQSERFRSRKQRQERGFPKPRVCPEGAARPSPYGLTGLRKAPLR